MCHRRLSLFGYIGRDLFNFLIKKKRIYYFFIFKDNIINLETHTTTININGLLCLRKSINIPIMY